MMHYIVHYGPNIIESGSLEMKIFFCLFQIIA